MHGLNDQFTRLKIVRKRYPKYTMLFNHLGCEGEIGFYASGDGYVDYNKLKENNMRNDDADGIYVSEHTIVELYQHYQKGGIRKRVVGPAYICDLREIGFPINELSELVIHDASRWSSYGNWIPVAYGGAGETIPDGKVKKHMISMTGKRVPDNLKNEIKRAMHDDMDFDGELVEFNNANRIFDHAVADVLNNQGAAPRNCPGKSCPAKAGQDVTLFQF